MKKATSILLCLAMIISLAGCLGGTTQSTQTSAEEQSSSQNVTATGTVIPETEGGKSGMKLYIDGREIPVIWEENDTVRELSEEVCEGDIVVPMSMYGGNEQVGDLGRSYTANDARIMAHNGDIMLYNSNRIVAFYGSNEWSYTKIGKINLTEQEVTELLSNGDVTLKITGAADKAAVVCFSGTGTTMAIAEIIADVTGADLFEIIPAEKYTPADLSYQNSGCRANKEQNDPSARPEIGNDLSGIEGCGTIYLGYPIWWGTNPRIIQTFLDTYDLGNASVYTFCTSGSSGIETSVRELQAQYPQVNIISGRRLNNATQADIEKWIASLG